jgi:hypothetical protein
MQWNFRLVRRLVHGREVRSLHRVLYEDVALQKPRFIERQSSPVQGPDKTEMLGEIELMVNAFDEPEIYVPQWNVV